MRTAIPRVVLAAAACGFFVAEARAAGIGEIADWSFAERAARFFSFSDPALQWALAGSMLLGASCGLMGSFLVVRRLALMGDALAHAVLPGVVIGYLWNMSKDPLAIFLGAVAAGLLGAGTVQLIRSTTRHREDAALGFVLASFFAAGICLLSMVQNLPGGSKAGLGHFLFGQAAAMGPGDVVLLGGVAVAAVAAVAVFFKELLVCSFDAGFARSAGIRVGIFQYGLMLLLSFAIVSSLQAVGVVLVSAMLVMPAAAAYLLAERLSTMVWLSAGFGMAAGAAGAFFSYAGSDLPTGPFMVLSAAAVFFAALVLAPRHGIAARIWRRHSLAARVRRENTLKAVYHVVERGGFKTPAVPVSGLAVAGSELDALRRAGMATLEAGGVQLTPAGWKRACEIVRNHRLWELYLTNAASLAPDHVHEDAEAIEHILGEDTVRRLEERLQFARLDPHGKPIPGLGDLAPGVGEHKHGSPA